MRAMGFDDCWIRLIMMCVSSVTYKVAFDDGLLGPIKLGKGLR